MKDSGAVLRHGHSMLLPKKHYYIHPVSPEMGTIRAEGRASNQPLSFTDSEKSREDRTDPEPKA